MSQLSEFLLLANYNQLMNQRQFEASLELSDKQLNQDCGAFFKSVLGTLNHILVGDIIWLKRFSDHPSSKTSLAYIIEIPKPTSLNSLLHTDFHMLWKERQKIDLILINWIEKLDKSSIEDCISYQNMAGETFSKSLSSLIQHLFLHQVHHRGQVTTLLSQFGVKFGETDLIEFIPDCSN